MGTCSADATIKRLKTTQVRERHCWQSTLFQGSLGLTGFLFFLFELGFESCAVSCRLVCLQCLGERFLALALFAGIPPPPPLRESSTYGRFATATNTTYTHRTHSPKFLQRHLKSHSVSSALTSRGSKVQRWECGCQNNRRRSLALFFNVRRLLPSLSSFRRCGECLVEEEERP